MLRILDQSTRLCDGIRRREMLSIGGLSALGLTLPRLLKARDTPPDGVLDAPTFGRAKNVIYLWLQGGPPQHETFDPKPNAPVEIRGPFQPIQTNVVGTQFCELLPRTARIADKLAIVRSLSTGNNIHSSSGYHVLTGNKYLGANARAISPKDWPWFGSLVKMMKPSETLPPLSTAWIPEIMRLNENVTPAGQSAGFMGRQWDPDRFIGDPSDPDYEVEGLRLSEIPPVRFDRRRSLLSQLDRHFLEFERGRGPETYGKLQAQAYDLLTTDRVRDAFAIQKEPESLKDKYGRTGWGQTVLLARRLVESGVRLVHVNWVREPGDSAVDNPMWDTHAQNADRMEDRLCPIFDVTFPALIEDLDQRGLLDETLVVAIAEFGRTPKINAKGGRDHWGPVFSFAMAGAGVSGGQVFGESDRNGAYPSKDVVTPGDVTATLFHLLGIDHRGTFKDPQRRERQLTTGEPLWGILSGGAPTAKTTEPGGNIARVPPYNDSLLLNTDFEADVPLYATDLGSRPKGWRATPRLESAESNEFGIRLIENDAARSFSGEQHVQIGFGMGDGTADVAINKGAQVLLAQEMRSPRAGTYHFNISVCGGGTSRKFFEQTFLKQFTCRLVIYRCAEATKNPAKRQELGSFEFKPTFCDDNKPIWQEFKLSKRLDSATPGSNFSTGLGLGVAVVIEKTAPGVLLHEGGSAYLRIDNAAVEFTSRSINDDVKV
jgi:hypothetical protein